MTDGNKYLSHILVKGLKNDASPVVAWLSEVYAWNDIFAELIVREEKSNSVTMVLNCLKGGLYSKHREVAIWTARIFTRLAGSFFRQGVLEQAWQWYAVGGTGLDGTIYFLKKHQGLGCVAFDLMASMGKQHLLALFTEYHKNVAEDVDQYWNNSLLFLKPLSLLATKCSEQEESELEGIIRFWLGILCDTSGNTKDLPNEKTVVMNLLVEIWLLFPNVFEENERVPEYTLSLLTRHARDKNMSLAIFALSNLFKLLEDFALRKSPYAPLLYKALTFSLVENYSVVEIRELAMGSFMALFQLQPAIPVGILVDPLVKQIQLTESSYNLVDFRFLSSIAANQRLNIKNGIQILDVLARSLVKDCLYCGVSSEQFLRLARRWAEEESMERLVEKFAKIALSAVVESAKRSYRPLRHASHRQAKKSQGLPSPLEHVLSQCIVSTLREIKAVASEDIKNSIHNNALAAYGSIRQQFSVELLPLKVLIKGDPDKLLSTDDNKEEKKRPIPKAVKRSIISLEKKKPGSHQARGHSVNRALYLAQ